MYCLTVQSFYICLLGRIFFYLLLSVSNLVALALQWSHGVPDATDPAHAKDLPVREAPQSALRSAAESRAPGEEPSKEGRVRHHRYVCRQFVTWDTFNHELHR